ncbi:hypothetical protein BTJ40_07610 [Microbulbifer sp. A4B17]|nr:hypothetical protein BTJ40_07610 [Microbulbifer sp. A4B17]
MIDPLLADIKTHAQTSAGRQNRLSIAILINIKAKEPLMAQSSIDKTKAKHTLNNVHSNSKTKILIKKYRYFPKREVNQVFIGLQPHQSQRTNVLNLKTYASHLSEPPLYASAYCTRLSRPDLKK